MFIQGLWLGSSGGAFDTPALPALLWTKQLQHKMGAMSHSTSVLRKTKGSATVTLTEVAVAPALLLDNHCRYVDDEAQTCVTHLEIEQSPTQHCQVSFRQSVTMDP